MPAGARARCSPRPARTPTPDVFKQLGDQFATWTRDRRRTIIAAWTRGSRERMANLLRENGLKAHVADSWQKVRVAPRDHVLLVTLGVERGFVIDEIGVIGEQDLLGERISRPARRRKRADQFIAEATEIAEGDLVVHQDHGIGRYDGLVTLQVSGASHDCLRLLYDEDAQAVRAGREHRGAEPVRRGGRRHAGQAGRRGLAEPQGAHEAAHPGHGGRADPHRGPCAGCATPPA